MKAVLTSIKPRWCELIASGKKTIEVRKTRPKIETPFKCYIYCTNRGRPLVWGDRFDGGSFVTEFTQTYGYSREEAEKIWDVFNGKVIGEFVCDCITPLYNICVDEWELLQGGLHNIEKNLVEMAKLSENELKQYANGKYPLFAWHISDLIIYDEPKELSDFIVRCHKKSCVDCRWDYESAVCLPRLTRPPQSWCYVDPLE